MAGELLAPKSVLALLPMGAALLAVAIMNDAESGERSDADTAVDVLGSEAE